MMKNIGNISVNFLLNHCKRISKSTHYKRVAQKFIQIFSRLSVSNRRMKWMFEVSFESFKLKTNYSEKSWQVKLSIYMLRWSCNLPFFQWLNKDTKFRGFVNILVSPYRTYFLNEFNFNSSALCGCVVGTYTQGLSTKKKSISLQRYELA